MELKPAELPAADAYQRLIRSNYFFAPLKRCFECRVEGFTSFNHAQFSGVNNGMNCYGGANNSPGDTSCLDQSFLHPNGAHNPRILQLGLKFMF